MQDFLKGAVRSLGIVAGFLPTAISFGAIAIQSQVSPLATVAMSVWIFAGASQFAAVEGLRQGLPWFSIVLTVWVVNLRHVPMSLAIARQLYHRFPIAQRWLLCHGIVDETFALELSGQAQPFAYYLGMHLCCWGAWVLGTWVGAQVGMQIPARWLTFALPSLFLYLLIQSIRQFWSRDLWWVLGAGTAIALVLFPLGATGVLLAILAIAALASWRLAPSPSGSQNQE